jgi:adenylate cyclase
MAIEALSPGRSLDERAALVATHWEAAGELLLAARWNARAASWIGLSDMSQAVAHWRKVNELTDRVPDAAGGATLSRVAHVRRLDYGWRLGMPEHEATVHYERARRILEQSGDRPKLVGLTALYATLRGMAGHIPEYEALSEEAYRLSVEVGDPGLRMSTIVVGLYARFVRGRLDDSLALADEALALAADDPSLGGHESSLVSPYAYCMSHRAWILCYQGRLEESAQTLDRALRTAEEQHDIETQGWTHMYHVLLDRYRDQPESALAHGTAAYEIAERVGSAFSRVWQLYFFGYAKFLAGETTEAIAAIERSIELSRQARTGLELEPVRLATLAEALLAAGESARALDTAREGVAMARQHGNDAVLPCCYRVLADALLASGASDSAAAARDALEHAIAAVEATGARMELPLIQSTRARLAPVS